MSTYTVFCIDKCQLGGTTWIGAIEADSFEKACEKGLKNCAENWEYTRTDDIRILGVAEGNVKILHWED